MDISFSCIALLNSCIPLLPDHSTENQRMAIIVQGFHGLQVYANMFWYRHLLAYCGLLRQHEFSKELLAQLQLLLRYRKDDTATLVQSPQINTEGKSAQDPSTEVLNCLPFAKKLVSDVLELRAKIDQKDVSDKHFDSKFINNSGYQNLILNRNFSRLVWSGSNPLQCRSPLLPTDSGVSAG